MIAVGDELLDTKPSFLAPDLSISDLQQSARRMKEYIIEEGQVLSDVLTDAFFIMMISSTVLDRYYFIHPHGQTDCSVYCWKIYIVLIWFETRKNLIRSFDGYRTCQSSD